MTDTPKDPLAAHEQAASVLYDRQPLTVAPGQFHASYAVQHAQKHSAEVYERTGERLAADNYRVLDFLDAGLVERLVDGDIDNKLATARVSDDPAADQIALSQQIAADTEESRRRIIAQYGSKDGPALLERTQRWVRSKPALARILQPRGLGSKPEVVEQLVAYVFSNGIR